MRAAQLLASAVIGLVVFWLATPEGLGQTFDTAYYRTAAQSFAQNFTLVCPDGSAYTNWPPLYPVLLAVGNGSGVFAYWLNAVALVSTLVFWQLLAQQVLVCRVSQWYLGFALALSFPLVLVSRFWWSEMVFMALAAPFVWASWQLFQTAKNYWLGCMVALSNLMFLQRHTALFFGIALSSVLWLYYEPKGQRGRWLSGSVSLFICFGLWQVRNHFWVDNQMDFSDNSWVISLTESLLYMADVQSKWLLPTQIPLPIRLLFANLLNLWLLYAVCKFSLHQWKTRKTLSPIALLQLQISFTLLVCIAIMLALQMNVREENERYLAPLFPLFILLLGKQTENLYRQLPNRHTRYGLIVILILWFAYNLLRTAKNVHFWHYYA